MTGTTNDEMPERLLSSKDLAAHWQVSTRTIKRMMDSGQIHFVRIGNQIRFRLGDILAYEKKMRS